MMINRIRCIESFFSIIKKIIHMNETLFLNVIEQRERKWVTNFATNDTGYEWWRVEKDERRIKEKNETW